MEKSKKEEKGKRIAIIALILALLALAFGFAAYSKSVDFFDEDGRQNYVVYKGGVLSINPKTPENGIVNPTMVGGALAEPATLTENGIININVHFTKPGQSATYSFFGVNTSKDVSYLNSVIFGDRTCYVINDETNELTKNACEDIQMTITVKNDTFKDTVGIIDNHILPAESNEPIAVTIKYSPKPHLTTQNFVVDFGVSTITYGQTD